MTMTTLNAIRAASPCHNGWTKLLKNLGKTSADDEPLPLLTVLDSNGLDDTLWVLDNTKCNPRLARHFGAWCAEQVLPIFEDAYPNDMRPRNAIAVARSDDATPEDRAAARDAAGAARDAAWDAARAAARDARDAAWDAAGAARDARDAAWAAAGAARDAAWAAARAAAGAARDAAWAAAWAAAWDAARAAARDAAWDAAWDAQELQFRKMLTEGF